MQYVRMVRQLTYLQDTIQLFVCETALTVTLPIMHSRQIFLAQSKVYESSDARAKGTRRQALWLECYQFRVPIAKAKLYSGAECCLGAEGRTTSRLKKYEEFGYA